MWVQQTLCVIVRVRGHGPMLLLLPGKIADGNTHGDILCIHVAAAASAQPFRQILVDQYYIVYYVHDECDYGFFRR